MTRRNTTNSHNRKHSANGVSSNGLRNPQTPERIDVPTTNNKKNSNNNKNHRQQLSLYISSSPPQSRRKNSPRRNLISPPHAPSPTTQAPSLDDVPTTTGNGVHHLKEEEAEEEQSEDVDDDNICLVCIGKCTCGKNEQKPQTKLEPVSPTVDPHFLRQRVKLRLSSPTPNPATPSNNRRGRSNKVHSIDVSPVKVETNGRAYATRSHDVIIRDGRGRGKSDRRRRPSEAHSDITMDDISDINLDGSDEGEEEEPDESEDEEDSDGDDDLGDDVDIEQEEEDAIIAEESRRLRQFSDDDDDDNDEAEEEDDEMEDDIFQERQYSSSESSPDEDHEFYQNDLYLDTAFCNVNPKSTTTPRRSSYDSDAVVYENPILRALFEEHKASGELWDDNEQDRVGWECFIDDTDVEIGEDWMHLDDESTRYGGGDTTDEEDFKTLAPPAPAGKKKSKKKNSNNDVVADVVTTAHQPPPLATWERGGNEITIIDALPQTESPMPSPARAPSPVLETSVLASLDDILDASALSPDASDCESESSNYTITRTQTPLSRKDSTATATSFTTTDNFVTPSNRFRKVPLGSYRRKVMLSERSLETREKSVFLKEWYTLQERRNLRELSKSRRNLEFMELSPGRGRRREKLRTARRARKEHDKSAAALDMQFIKKRRTSDIQGSGSSAAALMESLGLDYRGDLSEEEYDEDEFEVGGVVNGVGERMVLDDDLELAQFIVPPYGGIDLSPLFGAVDA